MNLKGGKEREKRGKGRSFRINLKDGVKDTNAGKESQDSICFIFWNSASLLLLGLLSSFCLSLKVISRQYLLSLQTENIFNFLSYLSSHAHCVFHWALRSQRIVSLFCSQVVLPRCHRVPGVSWVLNKHLLNENLIYLFPPSTCSVVPDSLQPSGL